VETILNGDFVNTQQRSFIVDDISVVASVRREALKLAGWLGFDETALGRVGVIVSEVATNIVKHAGSGEIVLRPISSAGGALPALKNSQDKAGLEIIAIDSGDGIADIEANMRDGMSSTGTAGSGLGALRRLANSLEIYAYPGKGSVFYMTVFARAPALDPEIREREMQQQQPSPPHLLIGAISIALAGEEICGDGWCVEQRADSAVLAIADGLGHGPDAAQAARATLSALSEGGSVEPAMLLEMANERARPTRGAAMAITTLEFASQVMRYVSAGNIACSVHSDGKRKSLLSMNGIVGHRMQKIREISETLPANGVVIMHSDGIGTQWDLQNYPGLATRHPALIAAVLYRDFVRRSDDATVVVVRRSALAG
jgi:anti-sigma regulatory factor (Ser/Thr protein kinase)